MKYWKLLGKRERAQCPDRQKSGVKDLALPFVLNGQDQRVAPRRRELAMKQWLSRPGHSLSVGKRLDRSQDHTEKVSMKYIHQSTPSMVKEAG